MLGDKRPRTKSQRKSGEASSSGIRLHEYFQWTVQLCSLEEYLSVGGMVTKSRGRAEVCQQAQIWSSELTMACIRRLRLLWPFLWRYQNGFINRPKLNVSTSASPEKKKVYHPGRGHCQICENHSFQSWLFQRVHVQMTTNSIMLIEDTLILHSFQSVRGWSRGADVVPHQINGNMQYWSRQYLSAVYRDTC